MVTTRDTVVGVVGAATIVLVLVGAFVVEDRAGPYPRDLEQAEVAMLTSGSLSATAPQGTVLPGGTCVPPTGAASCTEARTELVLEAGGLPEVAPARYVAALHGCPQGSVVLGTLEPSGASLRLDFTGAVDSRDCDALALHLTTTPQATEPGPWTVHRFALDVPATGGRVPLDGPVAASLGMGSGAVSVHQIGAAEVSATVDGTVRGLEAHPAWRYQAWFEGDGTRTDLGAVAVDDDGTATVDVRVERVYVREQARLVIMLHPAEDDAGATGQGFPALVASF